MEEGAAQVIDAAAGGKKKSNILRKKRPDNSKPADESGNAPDVDATPRPDSQPTTNAAETPAADETAQKVESSPQETEDTAPKPTNQQPAAENTTEKQQNVEQVEEKTPEPPPESPKPPPETQETPPPETLETSETPETPKLPSETPETLMPPESSTSPEMSRRKSNGSVLSMEPQTLEPNKDNFLRPQSALAPDSQSLMTSRASTALSAMSVGSTRVMLRKIPIREAEHNVQQPGFTESDDGFLGETEMLKLFPDRQVRVHVTIWNVATKSERQVPQTFEHLLFVDGSLPEESQKNVLQVNQNDAAEEEIETELLDERDQLTPDIYVLGLEESADADELILRMQDTLGNEYVCYAEQRNGALLLVIFIRRDLIWYTSAPETTGHVSSVPLSPSTKGASAISFSLFGTSFLFVNAHLSANENRYNERVSDYKAICSSIKLPKPSNHATESSKNGKSGQKGSNSQLPSQGQFDCTKNFDVVFFFGDLNFRLQKPGETVRRLLKSLEPEVRVDAGGQKGENGDEEEDVITPTFIYSKLLESDELRRAQTEGLAFNDFRESRITFPPTYKYVNTEVNGTKVYRLCAERTPSYTDRILYKSRRKNAVICRKYNALVHEQFEISDHRPVYAVFDVELQPQSDKSRVPPNLGAFNHLVYAAGLRRRAERLNAQTDNPVTAGESNSKTKTNGNGTSTSTSASTSTAAKPDVEENKPATATSNASADKQPEKKKSQVCTIM